MAYSDAQKEATARYNKKAYDRINLIVRKGKRKRISDYAASQGKSMNRFINDAIDAQMPPEKTEKKPPCHMAERFSLSTAETATRPSDGFEML